MRCTHYLVIILLLICQTSFGQIYQNMAQPGYKFARGRFDSVLTIPRGLVSLKNISGGQDTGQIRFNVSDSSVYVWNGRAFIKQKSATPSLQQVTDINNTTNNTITVFDFLGKTTVIRPSKIEFYKNTGNSQLSANDSAEIELQFPNIAGTFKIPISVNGQFANSQGAITIPTTDTSSLSNRINLRVKYTDTSSMLAAYRTAINTKLNISDTASLSNRINSKLNISDTSTMLSAYSTAINTNSAQGTANAAAIQQRIDTVRLNGIVLEARKNGVFVPQSIRIDSIVSYAKNAVRDSSIITFLSGRRLAVKDSVGSGGGSNIYTTDGSLTSARTLTLNAQPLTIAGTTSSRFHANGNVGIGTTTDAGYKLDVNGTARVLNKLSIGTIGLFAQDQKLSLEPTSNVISGNALTIEAGSTQAAGSSAFQALSQTSRDWKGMAAASNGDIFAVVNNGDIYKQTSGIGNFVGLGIATRQYQQIGIASNGDIFVCSGGNSANNGIYKSINGGTTFTLLLSIPFTNILGMCVAPNGDIYYSVSFGDIFKSVNGGVSFTSQGASGPAWKQMAAAPNGDIYAAVNNDLGQGQIWKQTGGTGSFVSLGQTVRNYWAMTAASNGDIYATVYSGDIYRQTGGIGNFIGLGQTTRNWQGITFTISGDAYASANLGDIYIQTAGTPNLDGGILVLQSGIGKGTGTSTINFNTGTTTSSGNILQVASTKMTILGNGSVGIGTTSPNLTSILDIRSTTQGFLPPRMTTTQKNAIASPAAGLVVYDTTLNKLCVRTASAWETITSL